MKEEAKQTLWQKVEQQLPQLCFTKLLVLRYTFISHVLGPPIITCLLTSAETQFYSQNTANGIPFLFYFSNRIWLIPLSFKVWTSLLLPHSKQLLYKLRSHSTVCKRITCLVKLRVKCYLGGAESRATCK